MPEIFAIDVTCTQVNKTDITSETRQLSNRHILSVVSDGGTGSYIMYDEGSRIIVLTVDESPGTILTARNA